MNDLANHRDRGGDHRDRADVEILLLDHRDRFGYVFDVHIGTLDVVHGVENRRALDVDLYF